LTPNTNTTITANASLTAGITIWNVSCTDSASYLGNSSNYTLTTDLTNPAAGIAWVSELATSGDGTTGSHLSINFTMSDTTFKNWTLRVYNSTPFLVATWNDTLNNNSQTLNYTAHGNGTYYVNLTVWDNSSRVNTTTLFTIYVDNLNPTLMGANVSNFATTSITLTTSASDSVSAIDFCNYTGAGSGNFTLTAGLYNANLSSLTANTQYTVNVSCYDVAGNVNTSLVTFTTWASSSSTSSSSSGSGGGGAAAGVPTSVANQFEQKTWVSINAGETATVSLSNGEIGVTQVSFGVDKTIWGPWAKVEKKDSLPADISKITNKVYKYVEITKGPALKDDLIKDAKIDFKVKKTWLSENELTKEQVALFRYVNNKWTELTTTVGTDDGTYVHYSSGTPGFSYFAIGQKTTVVAEGLTPVEEVVTEPGVEPTPGAVPGAVVTPESKSLTWLLVVIAVIIAAVIIAVLTLKRKRA